MLLIYTSWIKLLIMTNFGKIIRCFWPEKANFLKIGCPTKFQIALQGTQNVRSTNLFFPNYYTCNEEYLVRIWAKFEDILFWKLKKRKNHTFTDRVSQIIFFTNFKISLTSPRMYLSIDILTISLPFLCVKIRRFEFWKFV